ncbi:MAG: hypothetical protein ACJ760_14215 [Thermoleophilaceae bacterium]
MTRERRRGIALAVLSVPVAGGLVLMSLAALLLDGMRCDDWCSSQPMDWREDVHAWQYSGQFALVAGVWVAVIAAGLLAARGRDRAAAVVVLAALTMAAAWLGIVFG